MNSTMSRAVLLLHERLTGRHILEKLDELNRTQWLSRDELTTRQLAKLQRLVEYAYQYVPYYHRTFDEMGFHPADLRQDITQISTLPILTKALIRQNWQDLLTTEPNRRKQLSPLSTSGSTGEPLKFFQDSDFRDAVTADIQRHLSWAGYQPGDHQAYIWGAPTQMSRWRKMRLHLIDLVWNRLLMDAFMMTETSMGAFANRIQSEKPKVLFGYASALYAFAQFVERNSLRKITFDGLFTTSETLLPPVRHYLEERFGCKVFNRYGTLELGGVACECEAHSGLHISMENNFVEIISNGSTSGQGEVGELIVTNLNNRGMPFIRYDIGDVGSWSLDTRCPCGRESVMLNALEGRLVDSFATMDGRIVWAGFAGAGFRCMTHPSIRQFQVVQKRIDQILVRLVPEGEITQSTLDQISEAIRTSFGEGISVDFEFLNTIPPLPSGKHQYAISEVNKTLATDAHEGNTGVGTI